jgi:acetyl-CoA acyltransferase 2
MSVAKQAVFVVGAKRTPFGAFGGKLKTFSATDLAVHSSKAALASAGLSADKVNDTYMGNVIGSSPDYAYLARHVSLKSGAPVSAPSLTINRLCGSGFEAVCLGAESILLGKANIALCGGTENMSQAPMMIDGLTARWGAALGTRCLLLFGSTFVLITLILFSCVSTGKGLQAQDSLWNGLTDTYAKLPMGLTAEKLGAKYGITRDQCDEFGLRFDFVFIKLLSEFFSMYLVMRVEVRPCGRRPTRRVSSLMKSPTSK